MLFSIELRGQRLGAFAALTINNSALARARAEKINDLAGRLGLHHHAISQIGPVEAGDKAARLAQMQLLDNVLAHPGGGGGGQGHHRHAGKERAQLGKLPVFGPEIVAPFADAMGLVHGDQIDVPTLEILQETGQHQPFRRDVKKAVFALMKAAQPGARLAGGEGGIEERGGDAGGLERVHLVLHQRDQRRNDHGQAGPEQGGQLEAERFAAAGGEQGEDIASGERVADNLALERAKGSEAEIALQQSRPGIFVQVHAMRRARCFMGGMMEQTGRGAKISQRFYAKRLSRLLDCAPDVLANRFGI